MSPSAMEQVPCRQQIYLGRCNYLCNLDEFVGLMGYPLAPRPIDDYRQMAVTVENGSVGCSRHSAQDGFVCEDHPVRLRERLD